MSISDLQTRKWKGNALRLGVAVAVVSSLPGVAASALHVGWVGASVTESPTAQPAITSCGVAAPDGTPAGGALITPATANVAAPSVVSNPNVTVVSGKNILGFTYANSQIYAQSDSSISVYSSSGVLLRQFAKPTNTTTGTGSVALTESNSNPSITVDPAGDIYFYMEGASAWAFYVVALSPSGSQLWDYRVAGVPNGLFTWHDAQQNFALALVVRGQPSGVLLTSSGSAASGTEPVPGTLDAEYVSPGLSAGLLVTDSQYVDEFDSTGKETAHFGDSATNGQPLSPGSPFEFGQLGSAVQIGSTIYVADAGDGTSGHGIDLFTTSGVYEGAASSSSLGTVTSYSPMFSNGGSGLYYLNANGIALVSTTNVAALAASPALPTQGGFSDTLGIGAGISTPATANYFPAGTAPTAEATFDGWWKAFPDALTLSYAVADRAQVTADHWPVPSAIPITPIFPSTGGLTVPLILPPATPGTYLVNADLQDNVTGVTIGSTCLTYSVGSPGDPLNFSQLADGPDYGGPGPVRGVQLASDFGTNLDRVQLQLAMLLPSCDANNPSSATCGPGAFSAQGWANYDPEVGQAASDGASHGVTLEVQVGGGSSQDIAVGNALIASGLWQQDVSAIVEHFHSSAPALNAFEAWNEPNTVGFSPSAYVTTVLAPFSRAVAAVNAADGSQVKVVGGSVAGMDLGYWSGIAQAGGFADMDVVGIHPYAGFNRSYEEEGTVGAIQQLKALMQANGANAKPIWVTEQGWWSDGESGFYNVGDYAARAFLQLRALGVTNWNYFITEGAFDGPGTSFSLIQANGTDLYVKPAGLALMTVSRQIAGRPFLQNIPLAIPHAYGMLFGPTPGGTADLLAVWTDDLSVPAEISLTAGATNAAVSTTDVLGAPGQLSLSTGSPVSVTLSGAPIYLAVPSADTVTVQPAEAFGSNAALQTSGAVATASSSQGGENAPSDVIKGSADAQNGNGLDSTPAWASSSTDSSPSLQVAFGTPQTLDRVIVATSSITSVLPGLRNYTVQLDANGTWQTVATVTDEFFSRMEMLPFAPVSGVTAVRLQISAIDYGSVDFGLPPAFWDSSFPNYATVYALEAYGPGSLNGSSTEASQPTVPTPTTIAPTPTTVPATVGSDPSTPTTVPAPVSTDAPTTTVPAVNSGGTTPTTVPVTFTSSGTTPTTAVVTPQPTATIVSLPATGAVPAAAASPVSLSIAALSLPDATIGSSYGIALAATGRAAPYSWRVVSGSLPRGVVFAPSGLVAGTPVKAGRWRFTVESVDAHASSALQPLVLTVRSAPRITTSSLSHARVRAHFVQVLTLRGGSGALRWFVSSGSLPRGIRLSSSGVLSGTPLAKGTSTFTVAVRPARPRKSAMNARLAAVSSDSRPVAATATYSLQVGG